MKPTPAHRRVLMAAVAVLLVATSLAVAPFSPAPAAAAQVGPLQITNTTVSPTPPGSPGSPLRPGDEVTYTVNYSCSTIVEDSCAGVQLTHSFPTFTDINGDPAALEWVGSTTIADWGAADLSVPGQVSWTATPAMLDGDSGLLTFTLRVPLGIVPTTEQTLDAGAVLHLGPDSAPVELADPVIAAASQGGQVSKSGPSTRVLRAAYSDTADYTISLCPPADGALWPEHEVVDVLPPGGELVDPLALPGSATYDTSGAQHTITWVLTPGPPPNPANGCIELTYQVRFPNEPGVNEVGQPVGNDLTFKTNEVTVEGFSEGSVSQGVVGTDTHTLELIAPPVNWGRSKHTGGDYFVLDGDTVTYFLGANNSSDPDAPGFSTATLLDTLPPALTLTEIHTGTWGDLGPGGSAEVQVSTDGQSSWTTVSTTPGQIVTTGAGGVTFADATHVRWVFDSPESTMVRNWSASGQRVVGDVSGGPGDLLTNCLAFQAEGTGVTFTASSTCADVLVELTQPHPRILKRTPAPSDNPQPSPFEGDLPANTLLPGQSITYTIDVENDTDATGPLVEPRVWDCVPSAEFLTVTGVSFGPGGVGSWTSQHGTGAEDAPLADDCEAADGTYLQFQLSTDLAAGEVAPQIRYEVEAIGWEPNDPTTTPPGFYDNTAVVTATGGPAIEHCVSSSAAGTPAVDGTCSNNHRVTVPAFAQLESRKLVRGALDSGFNRAGTTVPGGQVTWQLEIRNVGNVSVEDVHYVDVLPHIGDTGVRRIDTPRGTQFDPYLVTPVTPVAGWEVDYSLSANPCRPEVLGPNSPGTNCEDPQWASSPDLGLINQYRSIRLRYVGDGDDGVVPVGSAPVVFEFNMVTPVVDPTYADGDDPYGALLDCTIPISDPAYSTVTHTGGPGASTLDRLESASPTCPMASNSFAYGVRVPADQLNGLPDPGILAAEPVKVDLHVAAEPTGGGNGIGDRVWYDRDLDGIQDPDEVGVPGVRVELYRIVGGSYTLVDTTFTDSDGRYLFVSDPLDLPDGDYVVRFYPPPNHDVSPPNQGTDSSVDSDVPRTPTTPGGAVPVSTTGGAFHETPVVNLSGGVVDLTWDMGIWGSFDPAIDIDKVTKDSGAPDSEAGDGVEIVEGRPVTWIYTVTNTGDARLEDVVVDDDGGPDAPFSVTACEIVDDGVNVAGVSSSATAPMALNRGAVMRCTAEGVAILGHYENVAEVTGTPTLEDGSPPPPEVPDEVSDDDPSDYLGIPEGTYAIGDRVWIDENRDGIQDPGEPGVPGVTVELLHPDGEPVLVDDEPLVTITDDDGRYVFDDVPAGSYRIRFSGVPDGYEFTLQHEGADIGIDSNSDEIGMTEVFEVGLGAAGVRPVSLDDAIDEPLVALLINPTIDAGIRLIEVPEPPAPPTPPEEPEVPEDDGVSGDDDEIGDEEASGWLPWTGSNPLRLVVLGLLAVTAGVAIRLGPRLARVRTG